MNVHETILKLATSLRERAEENAKSSNRSRVEAIHTIAQAIADLTEQRPRKSRAKTSI